MRIAVRNRCSDFDSYRAARVKSLFNAESGCDFSFDVELDLSGDWQIGVVVGPSGSGKTSIGRLIFGEAAPFWEPAWPDDKPIVDAIAPTGSFDDVTAALGSVGLGTVPTWLRPYPVLSNGEKFRADLARLVVEAPGQAIVDEFTSVVDRQIAKFGALAFAKGGGRRASGSSCSPRTTTWSNGSSPIGPLTQRSAASRGGLIGDLASISKSGRRTALTGRCLSRITI